MISQRLYIATIITVLHGIKVNTIERSAMQTINKN